MSNPAAFSCSLHILRILLPRSLPPLWQVSSASVLRKSSLLANEKQRFAWWIFKSCLSLGTQEKVTTTWWNLVNKWSRASEVFYEWMRSEKYYWSTACKSQTGIPTIKPKPFLVPALRYVWSLWYQICKYKWYRASNYCCFKLYRAKVLPMNWVGLQTKSWKKNFSVQRLHPGPKILSLNALLELQVTFVMNHSTKLSWLSFYQIRVAKVHLIFLLTRCGFISYIVQFLWM